MSAVEAASLEHPGTDLDDEPALFRDLDHRHRRNRSALRMCPPKQRLDTGDELARAAHDRLVCHVQLVFQKRCPQVAFETVASVVLRRFTQVDDLVTGAALSLRLVHRDVGIHDEPV